MTVVDPGRRRLLQGAAASVACGVLHAPSPAGAANEPARDRGRLVTVFLRGGMDHLSAVFPLDDADLRRSRPTIAIDGGLPLAGGFGLHPAMTRLHERFRAGSFVPVVATGNPAGERSHFVAQDLAALGADAHETGGHGWLARHLLATTAPEEPPLRAITMGANVDRSLAGYPALGLASIQTFGLGAGRDDGELEALLRATHAGRGGAAETGRQALAATEAVAGLPASDAGDPTRRAFADIATLLDEGRDAGLGTEVVTVDLGGWDTHDRMGTTSSGEMRTLLAGLDDALGRFCDDLDARGLDDVRIVVQTEFGRRVAENGSGGTDHGWGATMFVLGRGLRARRVHGAWPGLDPDVLGERGDVPTTTDFRDVLAEIAGSTLGADPATCFPDHDATPVGLLR